MLSFFGGEPVLRQIAVPTAGTGELPLRGKTGYLQIRNTGANVVRIYFTQADYDADVVLAATDGWLALGASASVTEFWEGPAWARRIWMRAAVGASTVSLVQFIPL